MRDLILSGCILGLLPVILRYPACGLLTWEWFSLLSPHQQVYGFAQGQPFGLLIAAATIGGWLMSRERKRWTPDAMPWLMLLFLAWITFNSFFAPYPDWSWPLWNRTARIFVFVFLVFVLMNTKARIHAMIWVLVISIGYFGVKGGAFTLKNGGGAGMLGPPDSILGDNNQLALAVVFTLPLLNYLRMHTRSGLIRAGAAAALGLQILMVFGSYSRGGVIALGVCLAISWWRSDHKIIIALLALVIVAAGLNFMPHAFFDRMSTIQDASQDSSFHGRVVAWQVATLYAIEHFPFGAGFSAAQLSPIFNHYFPDEGAHAAHSIYFEVLGDHGFPALGIYLLMLVFGLRNCSVVMRQTRGQPGLRWANDLARMMQVSIISFCVGGAALSMSYFDGFLGLLALVSTLRELTKRTVLPAGSGTGRWSRAAVAAPDRAAARPPMLQPAQRGMAGPA